MYDHVFKVVLVATIPNVISEYRYGFVLATKMSTYIDLAVSSWGAGTVFFRITTRTRI